MKTTNRIKLYSSLLLTLFTTLIPAVSQAVTLTKDTIWQGEIKLNEDVLVPKGITLTIRPATKIKVAAAESTKTDPEYLSPLTEITIRGTLMVEGNDQTPVEFSGQESRVGSWAGITIDQGSAIMHSFSVKNAENAVHVLDGNLQMQGATLKNNRYGLVLQGNKTDATQQNSLITDNDYGLLTLQGARLTTKASALKGNRKQDSYNAAAKEFIPDLRLDAPPDTPVTRRYQDEAFRGDMVWQGHIEIAGTIRVPQGSRLIIMPGTIVEFVKKDTNGDGIGESGIMIQGRLIAKGTKDQPIVFRSAEIDKKMGDWDSINIMDSAEAQNLIEYCRIENAYRGLHFHFSNVAVYNSFITDNYRGIQFQESQVDIKGNYLGGNKSGVQGRDSDLLFADNLLHNNYVGANFYRATLSARGNRIVGNSKEGWRIREGISTLQENLIDGNRNGLMLADMFYGDYSRNSFTNNLETGLSLKNADNIEVIGNVIAGNGINGINIQESRAMIKYNQITDNAERGIGIQTFDGLVTENNLANNGQYAIDLDGAGDVAAPDNWWGDTTPEKVIFDKRKDPARGRILHEKPRKLPFPFAWPLSYMATDTTWRGNIVINKNTAVMNKAVLTVAPKTKVEFSHGTGLLIKGRIIAKGTPAEKIIFTSLEKKAAADWGEIQLEYATGSEISDCVIEYATWGLHSHFTNVLISDSHFTNNFGGMRFRSGPVEIKRSTFDNNSIGIRAYLGNAIVRENTITRNEVGIFVREKGGGLEISRNNMFDNSSYNIRVGDFNNEDVSAKDNWWGTNDPFTTIFDGRSEPGIGNVLYEPFQKDPFKIGSGGLP